mmetsp:Transcript_27925/g.87080  ORF Transcript_27925/g.87080 Transcript_27925/m.87080 type:complete len:241 (-) Transcript_27925:47-769(-)
MEAARQELHTDGGRVGIHVGHEDHDVPWLRMRLEDLQQVECVRSASADAARADGQGAVVVHEEQDLLGFQVLQPHPLRGPHTVAHVVGHVVHPARQQLPDARPVSHAARPVPEDRVFGGHACMVHKPLLVLALLETDDVEGCGLQGLCDELRGHVAMDLEVTNGALRLVEQLPPEEVVGHDVDLHRRAVGVGTPDLRQLTRLAVGRMGLLRHIIVDLIAAEGTLQLGRPPDHRARDEARA